MTETRRQEIETLCARMRQELMDVLYAVQTGHPGGSLSCCEILATLYFHTMNIDPSDPQRQDRDRLILSKGHAAPMLYLCLAHKGFFPIGQMKTLRQLNSSLQGHPCAHKTPGVDLSTGPLGLGLSAGVGMALAARVNAQSYRVFVILGDGEIQEGAVWEAAMTANKYKAENLIAIVDHNKVQLDGTNEEIMPMGNIAEKFSSFGWRVFTADGHDVASLTEALDSAVAYKDGPSVLIAETVKGKGVSFMEGKHIWHGRPLTAEDYEKAKAELKGGEYNE